MESLIPEGVLPNIKSTCAEVIEANPNCVRIVWGYADSPDHNNRRCIDDMIVSRAAGDQIAAYLWKHRERLGLNLIIWYRRIIRTYDKFQWQDNKTFRAGTWAPYHGPKDHKDHPHFECMDKAYRLPPTAPHAPAPGKGSTSSKPEGSTSYPAPKDCIIYHDIVRPGWRNSDSIWWIDRWLNTIPMGSAAPMLSLDANYDAKTVAAAKAFQRLLGDKVIDGDLGPKQTVELYTRARKINPKLPEATFDFSSK